MKLNNPVKTMRKAIKHASRDAKRPILMAVHLDENGDVVATDSYRLFVEHRAWDGPTMDVDFATAYDISKLKVNEADGTIVKRNGKLELKGTGVALYTVEGKFPNYRQFLNAEHVTAIHTKREELLGKMRELIKAKCGTATMTVEGDGFTVSGERFEGAAVEGKDMVIGFDPKYVRDALVAIDEDTVTVKLTSPLKPAIFTAGNTEIAVMPVRLEAPKKGAKMKKQEKHPVSPAVKSDLARAIHRNAIERAANDPDSRVEGKASAYDRDIVWKYEKSGQLTKEECGDFTSWYLEDAFVTCIERRWSKRKIHLTYPELKPAAHKVDKVAEMKAERAAKEKAAAEVKAEVAEHADVTAVTIEPKKLTPPPVKKKEAPKVKAPEKKEDEVEKRIAELEKELKAARKELEEVWKENETLKAKPKETPKAPAPPKETQKADVAEAVSLETMKAWCEGKGLIATQKAEGCCIWVEGESKPYAEELKEMGFRFAKKRKSWYHAA